MPENLLDRIIRQKLESFQVPFQKEHWSEFARQYLPEEISPNVQESLIQAALSSYTLPPAPEDWELFEQSLPPETPVISLTGEEALSFTQEDPILADPTDTFPDELFREKLLLEELPYEQGDWELLANQLDGNLFDQAIRSRLHSYSLPVSTVDWYDMSSQIDTPMYASFKEHLGTMEISYRHSDWRLFAREALGYNPWYKEWRNLASIAAVLLLLFSSLTPAFISSNTPSVAFGEPEVNENTEGPFLEALDGKGDRNLVDDPILSTNKSKKIRAPYIATGNVTGSVRQIAHPLVEQNEPAIVASPLSPIQTDYFGAGNDIQKIKPRKASWNEIGLPTKAPYWANWFTPKTHLYSLSVGPYASFGKTRAELSSIYGTPGYTAGLRVELGLTDDVSLITGLQYERRGFSHRFYAYTPSQQTIENIIDADMQLAEIPLLIRYYVPAAPKVRMYGQTGIVTMVSLKEEYQLYQNTGSIAPISGPEGRNLRLANPAGGQQRSLETYTGNIYGGIGISVQASDRIFIEAEPYLLLSLQKTKGSGALGVEKRMYHGGVGFSVSYRLK